MHIFKHFLTRTERKTKCMHVRRLPGEAGQNREQDWLAACLPDCCTKGLLRSFICKWKPNAHADKQDERTSDDTHTRTHKEQKKQWKDNLAATVWQTHTQHPPRSWARQQQQQRQPDNVWLKDYKGHLYAAWLESRWKCREQGQRCRRSWRQSSTERDRDRESERAADETSHKWDPHPFVGP